MNTPGRAHGGSTSSAQRCATGTDPSTTSTARANRPASSASHCAFSPAGTRTRTRAAGSSRHDVGNRDARLDGLSRTRGVGDEDAPREASAERDRGAQLVWEHLDRCRDHRRGSGPRNRVRDQQGQPAGSPRQAHAAGPRGDVHGREDVEGHQQRAAEARGLRAGADQVDGGAACPLLDTQHGPPAAPCVDGASCPDTGSQFLQRPPPREYASLAAALLAAT